MINNLTFFNHNKNFKFFFISSICSGYETATNTKILTHTKTTFQTNDVNLETATNIKIKNGGKTFLKNNGGNYL